MNPLAERWILSAKSECLDRMIFFGIGSLQRALGEYVIHYNRERPHQSLNNELISGATPIAVGDVVVKERLGGLLNHYHRPAA